MVELGAIAGIPVAVILSCLLKCAVEVSSANERPAEVQNLLYMQCVADCLLPSGLPDPDRYKTDDGEIDDTSDDGENDDTSSQQKDLSFIQLSSGNDINFPEEEGAAGDEETSIIEIDGNKVRLQTEYRRNLTVITIEDDNISKKYQNDEFVDIYRPDIDLTPKIKILADDVLNKEVDVSNNGFSVSIVVPDKRREAITSFRKQLIEILRDEGNH